MTRERRLTQVFIKLADTLVDDFELAGFLGMLAEETTELLEVDAVGLTLAGDHGVLRVLASPNSPAELVDGYGGYAISELLPLCLRGEAIGSMDLFRHGTTGFSEDDLTLGQALADMATIGLLHERGARSRDQVCGQLQFALDSRVLIEQAKGMLAERAGLSLSEAFNAMRSYARGRGCELASVASGVLDGTLRTGVLLAR
ncbi:ANTAR domain-containing protein [Kribbella sp. CA-293567]|uniref:ANTAR domain-containing protein n=1 Tax=Kribbella sp. CA-293567 TaxID=3002436 RepID=UPI0022DCFBEE|nr:ANTAR domain-containing protein [Kribbella sp. CA-293567]WBQ02490.1 ANTAR domain-containing protein [Kribbella sp. CA-293567]